MVYTSGRIRYILLIRHLLKFHARYRISVLYSICFRVTEIFLSPKWNQQWFTKMIVLYSPLELTFFRSFKKKMHCNLLHKDFIQHFSKSSQSSQQKGTTKRHKNVRHWITKDIIQGKFRRLQIRHRRQTHRTSQPRLAQAGCPAQPRSLFLWKGLQKLLVLK